MWRNSRNLRTACNNVARFVQGARHMSNLPESTVHGGPQSKSPWKRHLEIKYRANQLITIVTAYDYPTAFGGVVTMIKRARLGKVGSGQCNAAGPGGRHGRREAGGRGVSRVQAAEANAEAGIAVMGHVGLTPQAISVLGGFRPHGRNVDSALLVLTNSVLRTEMSRLYNDCCG